ncbi:MAG: hypothetical protein LBG71_03085 [Clostridiales Family XIII bacterium]|nr:hypothetical protein [Clostridiales Family XIII bacterium]
MAQADAHIDESSEKQLGRHLNPNETAPLPSLNQKARQARALWQEHGFGEQGFVLLLPDGDGGFNERVKTAFEAKLGGRQGISVSGDEARRLVALYSLYEFSPRVVIGSLDEPYGRKLRHLLDCGIATEDELINDVILGALDGSGA